LDAATDSDSVGKKLEEALSFKALFPVGGDRLVFVHGIRVATPNVKWTKAFRNKRRNLFVIDCDSLSPISACARSTQVENTKPLTFLTGTSMPELEQPHKPKFLDEVRRALRLRHYSARRLRNGARWC